MMPTPQPQEPTAFALLQEIYNTSASTSHPKGRFSALTTALNKKPEETFTVRYCGFSAPEVLARHNHTAFFSSLSSRAHISEYYMALKDLAENPNFPANLAFDTLVSFVRGKNSPKTIGAINPDYLQDPGYLSIIDLLWEKSELDQKTDEQLLSLAKAIILRNNLTLLKRFDQLPATTRERLLPQTIKIAAEAKLAKNNHTPKDADTLNHLCAQLSPALYSMLPEDVKKKLDNCISFAAASNWTPVKLPETLTFGPDNLDRRTFLEQIRTEAEAKVAAKQKRRREDFLAKREEKARHQAELHEYLLAIKQPTRAPRAASPAMKEMAALPDSAPALETAFEETPQHVPTPATTPRAASPAMKEMAALPDRESALETALEETPQHVPTPATTPRAASPAMEEVALSDRESALETAFEETPQHVPTLAATPRAASLTTEEMAALSDREADSESSAKEDNPASPENKRKRKPLSTRQLVDLRPASPSDNETESPSRPPRRHQAPAHRTSQKLNVKTLGQVGLIAGAISAVFLLTAALALPTAFIGAAIIAGIAMGSYAAAYHFSTALTSKRPTQKSQAVHEESDTSPPTTPTSALLPSAHRRHTPRPVGRSASPPLPLPSDGKVDTSHLRHR